MSSDLEPLLAAVSPDAPSGADLEYDPDFSRMEKAAQGTPDQEFGSTKIEGTPADWDEVRDAALSILKRSKDLRAATYFAEAQLATRGLCGFRDAIKVICVFVQDFWDTVFPLLDEDDDNDPTIRINSLAGLCNVGGLIRQLKATPILLSRSVGRFSVVDAAIAKGELPAPAGMEEPPTQKKIDAAVSTSDAKEFDDLVQAVDETIQFIDKIESGFSDRLGPAVCPNLDVLAKELKSISRFHKMWVAKRKEENGGGVSEEPEAPAGEATGSGSGQAVAVVRSGPFLITRREEAIEGLDKIIAWFERNEPSSPLPMLLRRAKRLSTMSFIDILRDISPDGVTQAVLVGGPEAEKTEPAKASTPAPASSKASPSKSSPSKTPVIRDDEY